LGQLKALPWSNQAASSETSAIALQLAKMNELGFLTINSQPAVNGMRSDDPQFGWGPSNGYVYQKVSTTFDTRAAS
jgi:methylenetetrahydrofolate reductase (NADPH)